MIALELRIIGLAGALLLGGSLGLNNKMPIDIEESMQFEGSNINEVATKEEIVKDENEEPSEVNLLAVGDIMLGRYVETLMNANGDNYPFANIQDLIEDQDIVFANFEGPIVSNHVQTPDFTTSFDFAPRMASVLSNQGFNLVSLANNHTLDKGVENFEQTRIDLIEAGIESIGHSRDESSNYTYKTIIKGQDFLFLAFNEAVNPIFNEENAIEATRLAAIDEDTFVVVSMHWGIEYQLQSASFQQELAHQLIEAGADLIIGHHPHVTQEVEVYQDRMIFYSLGNFIFDQYFSSDTQEELGFEMTLSSTGNVKYELIPIQSKRSQPSKMTEETKQNWLNSFALRSADVDLQEQIKTGVVELTW